MSARQTAEALIAAMLVPMCGPSPASPPDAGCMGPQHGLSVPMFHGDRARLGWNASEVTLTPTTVASPSFGRLWETPALDPTVVSARTYAAHLYASPLYLDDVVLGGGALAGAHVSALFVATSSGFVYAINAFAATCGSQSIAAGQVLWRTSLGAPRVVNVLDGGIPLGVLGTPVIDTTTVPPRLYVASLDAAAGWQVYALDVTTGAVISGWPVTLTASAVEGVNRNGPASLPPADVISQRGALNLSPDGTVLYVPFGAYMDGGVGWMVAIDTTRAAVSASFSGAPSNVAFANGGIWSSGGPTIDADGRVFATTGNSPSLPMCPAGMPSMPGVWGQTLLAWDPVLQLSGTYTPFNHCQMDCSDADLGSSSPVLLPDLDPASTTTPHLAVFGSKQGTMYLVDRDHLPGSLGMRPPCSTDASSDGSLLPPGPQPQFGTRGPLDVFGPYSDAADENNLDLAKSRSTPAFFRDPDGSEIVFVTGTSKAALMSATPVPPCIARLRVVTTAGQPAYLAIDRMEPTVVCVNPGPPVVSSNGAQNAIVWVLDENRQRSDPLTDDASPHPVLYAFDGMSLSPLWHSAADSLHTGGKYNTPLIAHGVVFVGTDRITAFGLGGS